jgi:hypothetical protein
MRRAGSADRTVALARRVDSSDHESRTTHRFFRDNVRWTPDHRAKATVGRPINPTEKLLSQKTFFLIEKTT